MKRELDELLCRDFPNLYKRRNDPTSPMARGFTCGDGWEPAIRRLSAALEELILKMPEDEREHVYAVQVKEKFGSLAFYVEGTITPGSHEAETAIIKAMTECSVTCETCGSSGGMQRVQGFWTVQCSTCFAVRMNKIIAKTP